MKFHTYGHDTATDNAKIYNTIKTPWDPIKPIEMIFKQIEDAQIFALCANLGNDLPWLIIYCLHGMKLDALRLNVRVLDPTYRS